MLTPKQLDQYPDNLVDLYAQAEADILADMAKRISACDYFIPAAQWQYQKLIDMGALHDTILTKLSQLTGKTKTHLQQLMKEAGTEAIKTDDVIYKKVGLDPLPINASSALKSVLSAGITNTGGLFDNLTRTTANTATRQFERVLDRAYMQITTGAFSYQESIRMAIKELAGKGIESIPYPSGHTDHMDVAVRRAVLTGVNQMALRMQDARADELGSDLVETTAHAGARPTHQLWQGRIFSRSGTHPKYPDFVTSTGYGTGPGLGGWNCRHSYFPYFEGISDPAYTQAELADMNTKKCEYNGEKLTEYEASQKQRLIERNIRRWKREFTGMDAAGLDTGESAAKIAQWQRIQKDFLQQTGLKRQTDREETVGYSKVQAKKVVAINTKARKAFAQQHIASVESQLINHPESGIINNNILRFADRNEVDKLLRSRTEELWSKLTPDEKTAAYEYTVDSDPFNRPLRGYDKNWEESAYKGPGNVPLNNEGAGEQITALISAIDKSELPTDMWLFRGSNQQSLAGLLKIDKSKVIPSNVSALNRKFSGKKITDYAFFSTGVAADSGFGGAISYEILTPKGVKGLYSEPFSHYGGTNSIGTWDGKQNSSIVSSEAEMLLQAGTEFEVQEIKLVANRVTVVLKALL